MRGGVRGRVRGLPAAMTRDGIPAVIVTDPAGPQRTAPPETAPAETVIAETAPAANHDRPGARNGAAFPDQAGGPIGKTGGRPPQSMSNTTPWASGSAVE